MNDADFVYITFEDDGGSIDRESGFRPARFARAADRAAKVSACADVSAGSAS